MVVILGIVGKSSTTQIGGPAAVQLLAGALEAENPETVFSGQFSGSTFKPASLLYLRSAKLIIPSVQTTFSSFNERIIALCVELAFFLVNFIA
ncbi:hypothetical protein EV2_038807 [Malus domestica]